MFGLVAEEAEYCWPDWPYIGPTTAYPCRSNVYDVQSQNVLERREEFVDLTLSNGIAKRTQDAHPLVARPDRSVWLASPLCRASSAPYSTVLTGGGSRRGRSCSQHAKDRQRECPVLST